MSKRKLLKSALTSCALILMGILVAWTFSTGNVGQLLSFAAQPSAKAAAMDATSSTLSDVSLQASPNDVFQCTSVGVAAYPNRIHVECSPAAPGGIRFFALGTNNSAHAARILSILSMAHVTSSPLLIEYDPNDTSGAAIGCLVTDCRLIMSAAILP